MEGMLGSRGGIVLKQGESQRITSLASAPPGSL